MNLNSLRFQISHCGVGRIHINLSNQFSILIERLSHWAYWNVKIFEKLLPFLFSSKKLPTCEQNHSMLGQLEIISKQELTNCLSVPLCWLFFFYLWLFIAGRKYKGTVFLSQFKLPVIACQNNLPCPLFFTYNFMLLVRIFYSPSLRPY